MAYALLLFPAFLAPTGVAYLALLVAVRRRFAVPARAVALSPVATLLLLLWALAARAPAAVAVVVAGSAV